jgi:predicted porin
MNKKAISLAIASALALPVASHAADEAESKALEVYGKVHVSVDYSDPDTKDPFTADAEQTDKAGPSFSSNSTRLGFKGVIPATDTINATYQIEQEVGLDDASGSLATRNSYAGLEFKGVGEFRLGHYDTPLKSVNAKWDLFGDTVGDSRKIIGAGSSSGNKLNQRAKNMLMYDGKFGGGLNVQAMYSTDPTDSNSGGLDNNDDYSMYSAGVFFKQEGLFLALAYEKWDDLDPNSSSRGETKAVRAAASYKFGMFKIGAIYEDINAEDDNGDDNDLARAAWGLNAAWSINSNNELRVQWNAADENDAQKDTDANAYSLGWFNTMNKNVSVYVAYTTTLNEDNAHFQGVDGGHGDEVKTDAGGEPYSVSTGLIFKF